MQPHTESFANPHETVPVHIAAKHLNCSTRTVRRWIQQHRLRAERIGQRAWAVMRCDIENLRNDRGFAC
jgi:excisionase family DNA binding protein